MAEMKEVAVLRHDVEAGALAAVLKERGIPHLIMSYHDAAYDGLFQVQKGWGCVRAGEADAEAVQAILDEVRQRAETVDYDADKVDEMTLALLYLTTFDDGSGPRAWKGMDWDALSRLHEKGHIDDPKSRAKSVPLTDEGARLSEELFCKHFGLSR